MGTVTIRSSQTSQGLMALSPWNGDYNLYAISAINLGSNFNSKLEIVSALNSFNLAIIQYHFNQSACASKYNPKVYLGTVQSVARSWNYDNNTGGPGSGQKSGSWPVYSY